MQREVSLSFKELADSAGSDFDDSLTEFFTPVENLTYQLRLPDSDSEKAPGVLVYISPKPGASMPPEWGDLLDVLNLAWVGAMNSGNETAVARRVGMALLAPSVARQSTPIDDDRMILSGFSGGGRVASMMIPAYPKLFSSALFICGANPLMAPAEETLELLKYLPIVFLTGTGDFNLEDTKFAISVWQHGGLSATQLMVVDGLDHGLPDAPALGHALESLA